jgi:hypothetical protein
VPVVAEEPEVNLPLRVVGDQVLVQGDAESGGFG